MADIDLLIKADGNTLRMTLGSEILLADDINHCERIYLSALHKDYITIIYYEGANTIIYVNATNTAKIVKKVYRFTAFCKWLKDKGFNHYKCKLSKYAPSMQRGLTPLFDCLAPISTAPYMIDPLKKRFGDQEIGNEEHLKAILLVLDIANIIISLDDKIVFTNEDVAGGVNTEVRYIEQLTNKGATILR